ncbi:MAG: branched-chain amino acid ABC transporter permease [Desulfomonile tiedjei]|nr:branched-chain amino acid ABC transporter permease [Desulfomonile tiedjei]
MNRYRTYIAAVLVLCVLVGIGLFSSRFVLYLTMRVMILSIFAMGYNILFGRTGLLSFGHAAFYAVGAYGTALCSMHLHTHPLLVILAGAAAAALFAVIIGFFCVRHTEIYFAMLTLAFGMLVFSLMWNWRTVTGGDDGLSGIVRGSISLGFFAIPIMKDSQYYFFVLFCFAVSVLLIHRIYQSPFGLILAGIRENHIRTEFAGLGVKRYRLAAFVVSGTFAGLAGSLGLLLESNVTPFAAHWSHSAEPVLVSLMGGLETFSGPIVGSVLFVVLRELIERFTHNWMLWFGLILLAIIMGFRGGVVGATSVLLKRFSERP